MEGKISFKKSLEQDLIYVLVILIGMFVNYCIKSNYKYSMSYYLDIGLLIIGGFIFLSQTISYLMYKNKAEIQEDIDILEEDLNEDSDSEQGKLAYKIKSIGGN